MGFFKYPSTPHLAILRGATVRDDKVLSPRDQSEFLSHDVFVEEKIDGANLGISFDHEGTVQAQNRGSILSLPAQGQWKPLNEWLNANVARLYKSLSDRYILFGEWCYATHSIHYDRLPSWFLGFDVYDSNSNQFIGISERNAMLDEMKIYLVPQIASGRFDLTSIVDLLRESQVGREAAEGLVLRRRMPEKNAFWKAKIVRAEFIQAIDDHWSRKPLRTNQLATHSFSSTNT